MVRWDWLVEWVSLVSFSGTHGLWRYIWIDVYLKMDWCYDYGESHRTSIYSRTCDKIDWLNEFSLLSMKPSQDYPRLYWLITSQLMLKGFNTTFIFTSKHKWLQNLVTKSSFQIQMDKILFPSCTDLCGVSSCMTYRDHLVLRFVWPLPCVSIVRD